MKTNKIGSHGVVRTQSLATIRIRNASPLLRGKALGGPRDNIILEAPHSWNGFVYTNTNIKSPRKHKGKYEWDGQYWIWEDDEKPSDGVNSLLYSPRLRGDKDE